MKRPVVHERHVCGASIHSCLSVGLGSTTRWAFPFKPMAALSLSPSPCPFSVFSGMGWARRGGLLACKPLLPCYCSRSGSTSASERAKFGTECSNPFGVKIWFPLGKRLLPDCWRRRRKSLKGSGVPVGFQSISLQHFDDLSVDGLETCGLCFPWIQMHAELKGKFRKRNAEKQCGFYSTPWLWKLGLRYLQSTWALWKCIQLARRQKGLVWAPKPLWALNPGWFSAALSLGKGWSFGEKNRASASSLPSWFCLRHIQIRPVNLQGAAPRCQHSRQVLSELTVPALSYPLLRAAKSLCVPPLCLCPAASYPACSCPRRYPNLVHSRLQCTDQNLCSINTWRDVQGLTVRWGCGRARTCDETHNWPFSDSARWAAQRDADFGSGH